MPKKLKKTLTSNTAFAEFSNVYKEYVGKEYVVATFIGREISMLKKAIDNNDYYTILCALYESLRKNGEKASIPFTLGGLSYYLPDCKRPDLYWEVLTNPSPSSKLLWRSLIRLETKWFPKSSDKQAYSNIVTKLEVEYGQNAIQKTLA